MAWKVQEDNGGILGFPAGDYDTWPDNIQWCFRWRIRNAMPTEELLTLLVWAWEEKYPNAIKEIRKAV